MMRVLLHPGFHKTGTTTAQDFLYANRKLIWPRAALVLPWRLGALEAAVFAAAFDRADASLAAVTAEMAAVLADLDLGPRRTILVSCENLLGEMPRGTGHAPYPFAAPILRAVLAAFQALPWPVEVTVHLSLRDQAAWEESVWAHQVRKTAQIVPFTEDLAPFRARLSRVPLAEQVARLQKGVRGVHFDIRDLAALSAAPFGPAQPFVDFLRLSRAQMAEFALPVPANAAPPRAVTEQLLELNRTLTDDRALAQAKRALLAGPAPAAD
ncbi:hypothetical protein [Phaeovulum vinaykumarii]|uniref:Sulfotransferase family protein n=1 Tax=Phaeovulum vinaykumarii TaxID=407234 RepID=A0A1N7MKF4_9RHOB|nr:hypothetical protein [Phaeovulum vinaykumarii]SIS86492.1 hypothetical protein SAMN05421795_1086 [Phaeovulum vinaykumarii]SOC13549.1 hypothetical protein SAMN05878426_108140 [Phaeovulum vinaykumarii]